MLRRRRERPGSIWLAPTLMGAILCLVLPARAYVGYDDDGAPMYGWSDSSHPDDPEAPSFSFSSIEPTGEIVALTPGLLGPLPIGFPFEFYGRIYEEVYVSGFGAILFAEAGVGPAPQNLPDPAPPNGLVAACWSYYTVQWDPGNGYYETRGSAPGRQFVFEWASVGTSSGSPASFEVVLDEQSGDVLVLVETMPSLVDDIAIGIESHDGLRAALSYAGRGPLDSYAARFVNLSGQPLVTVRQPRVLAVPEGGSVEVELEVFDRQGDLESVGWDLDGDGLFDDAEGTSAVISALGVDGPGTLPVTVEARDGAGNVRITALDLEVTNAPPEILNAPEPRLVRGREWTYRAELGDPGGDEVTFFAPLRPEGMIVLSSGGLRWQPGAGDVGDHDVRIVVTDDDDDPLVEGDGEAVMDITLTVAENEAPGAPVIIEPSAGAEVSSTRPSVVAEVPADAEGDPLRLVFEIDRAESFDSPALVSSGEVSAPFGRASWSPAEALERGERYFLRARAFDGQDWGAPARASFSISAEEGTGGGREGRFEAGGGCRLAPRRGGSGAIFLVVALALASRARRRSRKG